MSGIHMPQERRPQDGKSQCSNWWRHVRLYQKKKEKDQINKVAFVAVLLGKYLNLCILVLNDLYRINGYNNATTIKQERGSVKRNNILYNYTII
jgi:hypothetical protein